jgi:threonine dehydratase
VTLEPATTLADGIAVKRPGDLTFEHVRQVVDEIVTVSEEEIASAILYLLEREKTVVEGAGAVAVAALMNRKVRLEGRQVVAVVSGGNIDVNVVARVIERGLVRDGRLVRIDVALLDKPGQLARVSQVIASHRANVIEVHHSRAFSDRFGDTILQLTMETRGPDHVEEILRALRERGYAVRRTA